MVQKFLESDLKEFEFLFFCLLVLIKLINDDYKIYADNIAEDFKMEIDIKEKIPNEIQAAGTCTYIILTESLCL